jgi:hypothetical protein
MIYGAYQEPIGDVRSFTSTERASIDALLSAALVDRTVCDRLIHERDTAFLTANGLSLPVQRWLKNLPANNIVEIAQAVIYHP